MNTLINISFVAINISLILASDPVPEQIHLSLGGNPSEMMVTYTTFKKADRSIVRYNRLGGPAFDVNADVTHFKDMKDDTMKYEAYIHRVKLTGLQAGVTYEYKCQTDDNWSDVFKFKALGNDSDTPLSVAVYGDLGLENGVSTPQLKKDVKKGLYDTIFHVGDIAYNLNKDGGKVGDDFMNEIQDIAANVPYQVCPGNHEDKRNFTHYINRFSMIDFKSQRMHNHYYSLDLGSAHFIFFSSELYFWSDYFTDHHLKWQYEWLENDLKDANKPENRQKRPWIITLAHRPMYCIKDNDEDCFEHESILRKGRSGDDLKLVTHYGLEDLFYRYGVDIQFYGHKHMYERSYPIYDSKAYKGTDVYTNPKAPIHIITGVGGTTDRPSLKKELPDWTAFYARDYGYTRMNVQNKTHILIEQYSTENYRCKADNIWSNVFSFKVHNPDTPLKVAIYGDLGLKNGVSTRQLIKDVEKGLYDTVFHIGDIAYNLNSDGGSVGDDFMNSIQPIAANVPYQVCPGNHEKKRNFTHYMNRFSMVDFATQRLNNHYYSVDMGSAHFVLFSSEHYFYPQFFTESHIKWQYEWLENDLKQANKPESRQKRPWIITLAHRPM
ncbi:unnamed protein product, partial [Oppiella nova]